MNLNHLSPSQGYFLALSVRRLDKVVEDPDTFTKDWCQIVQDCLVFIFSVIGKLSLPTILKKDRKKVLPPKADGVNLMEGIIRCLWEEYDISINYDQLVKFLATEICNITEYTRYMKAPLSQNEINHNFLAFDKKNEYARLVADLYLPAISNALDMHLRVIQNIAGYYEIMNTYPLPNDFNPMQKKTIILIVIDDCYHPVVRVSLVVSLQHIKQWMQSQNLEVREWFKKKKKPPHQKKRKYLI